MCVPAFDKNEKQRDRTPHEIAWVDNMGPIYVVLITVISPFYYSTPIDGAGQSGSVKLPRQTSLCPGL